MADRPRYAAQRRFWARIRALRTFVIADLCGEAGSEDAAKMFIRRLRHNGIVEALPVDPGPRRGGFKPTRYQLARDLGQRCPRFDSRGALVTTPTAQERLWAAMRPLRKGFSVKEIATLARVPADSAKTYIGALYAAGYLRCIAERPVAQYRLRSECATGPEPPLRVDGGIWDVNRDELVPYRDEVAA